MSDPTDPPTAPTAAVPETAGEADGDGHADVRRLVLEALAAGPATGWELARRVDEVAPEALAHREGFLYPFLLDLRRRGLVEAHWADRADGRRRVYGLPGAAAPAPGERAPGAHRIPTDSMRRVADAATARLAFAPLLAREARAEIASHLAEDAAARERDGASPAEAEKAAIHALGDPWKIATDLSRAARGRRTVIFPRNAAEALLSLAIYDAGIVAAILATIAVVRFGLVGAYHIPTKSMEPTLHGDREGGDRILVLRLAPAPPRFGIEVFDGWGAERKQYVKRCVGLPGEDVRIREGDLWIDGHLVRKDGADLDALLFPLFDAGVERSAASRERRPAADRFKDRFVWEGGAKWMQWPQGDFEATAREDGEPAVLRWRDRLTDALYDEQDGDLRDGIEDVADGRIALDVTPLDADTRLLVRWARGAERCDAVLRGEQPGVALFVDGAEVARRADVTLPAGETTRVRFSQVDRVLRLEIDGDLVLRHDLPEPANPRRSGPSGEVSVRVPHGRVRLAPVRLERDVHWTSEYEGIERPRLGPDEYFMLGDNSSNSQDSRSRGAVHRNRLVGRPLLIVWPPSRFGIPR